MTSESHSGLARVGASLLPWLPSVIICRFWAQYFAAQSELADRLDATHGSAPQIGLGQSGSYLHNEAFTVLLLTAGFAFAIGLVLIAIVFVRRRRAIYSNS